MPDDDLLGTLQPPPPTITQFPPLGQLGAILSGLGAGIRGQSNPVLGQAQAQQDTQFRQHVQTLHLQRAVQQDRLRRNELAFKLYKDMSEVSNPEGRKIGWQGILDLGKKVFGIDAPPGLAERLSTRALSKDDIDATLGDMVAGVDQSLTLRNRPNMTPSDYQYVMQLRQSPQALEKHGFKSEVQIRKEVAEEKKKSEELIERDWGIPGGSEESKLAHYLHRKATGRSFFEGNDASRRSAVEGAHAEMKKRREEQKQAGIMGAVVTPQGGGMYWDRGRKQYLPALTKGELITGQDRFIPIGPQDMRMIRFAERADPQLVRLKQIIPGILTKYPAEVIGQVLSLKGQQLLGANPDLREFLSIVTDTNIEQTRVLSGGSTPRIAILRLVQGHIGPVTHDTVNTATRAVDTARTMIFNATQKMREEPMIRFDQRIGPGDYLVMDKRTGSKHILHLKENQISAPELQVLGEAPSQQVPAGR